MGAVATFDYGVWSTRYPEFPSVVSASLATAYFAEAGLYLDNTGGSPVTSAASQLMIMNMITSHIAALNAPVNEGEAQSLVGRISSASEGSVSVSVDLAVPGSAAWWAQTKYGLQAWQALQGRSRARYLPAPGRRRW